MEIPIDILEAARKLELWFVERNIKSWKLLGVQSRNDAEISASMRTELEELWLTVEATTHVRDDLRRAILKRFGHCVVNPPSELTASERFLLESAERRLMQSKADYQDALTKSLVLEGPLAYDSEN